MSWWRHTSKLIPNSCTTAHFHILWDSELRRHSTKTPLVIISLVCRYTCDTWKVSVHSQTCSEKARLCSSFSQAPSLNRHPTTWNEMAGWKLAVLSVFYRDRSRKPLGFMKTACLGEFNCRSTSTRLKGAKCSDQAGLSGFEVAQTMTLSSLAGNPDPCQQPGHWGWVCPHIQAV